MKEYNGFTPSMIVRGQAWQKRERSALGRHLVRVMTVSDGYVMARMKGCMPFTTFWKDFVLNFDRMPAFDNPVRRVDRTAKP